MALFLSLPAGAGWFIPIFDQTVDIFGANRVLGCVGAVGGCRTSPCPNPYSLANLIASFTKEWYQALHNANLKGFLIIKGKGMIEQ